ncbi:hypothetical protein RUM44_006466 [Polyplax serrata]|uniref:Uncharacterized protein n=1 Tax=Polyplax serrata TaxID=468196 RepID=A0ABR1AI64_POLSC
MQMQEQYGRNVVGGSDRRRRDPVFDDFDGNDGDNNDVEMTLNQTKSSSGVVRCERKKQTSNESNHRQKEFEIFMAAVLLACLPLGREREVSPKTKRQTKDGDADGKNRIVRRGKGMEERFADEDIESLPVKSLYGKRVKEEKGRIGNGGKTSFQGIASFISLATSAGICIAVSEKILRNSKQEDFDRIVERLLTKPNARGVVMFVDEDNTR